MDNEKTKNRLSDDIDVVNIGQYFEKSVVVAELKNRSEIRIREILIYSLLILFIVSTVATFVLIYLKAFAAIHLSDGIIYALIGASIAEIVSIIILPVKYLFPLNK
jgi:hypothetical protein